MILLFKYTRIFLEFLRGMLWSIVLFRDWGFLRVGRGLHVTGKLLLGKNVFLSRNIRIYTYTTIGNGTFIGDNVELRSNGGNRIYIGENCTINRNTVVIGNVSIKNDCMIAPNCVLAGGNHIFSDTSIPINKQGAKSKGIIIEENVWIGASSVILDGVTIGEGSVVGAGSVVTKNIPKGVIAVGNPCRIIKDR